MKFGILKERKSPPDRRVIFSPNELVRLKQEYQNVSVKVERSDIVSLSRHLFDVFIF